MCRLHVQPGNNKRNGLFHPNQCLNVSRALVEHLIDKSICVHSKKWEDNSPINEIFHLCAVKCLQLSYKSQAKMGPYLYCYTFCCRYRMEADFSWKDFNWAKSRMKYSSSEGLDLARFDYQIGHCSTNQMLILLLIFFFLNSFWKDSCSCVNIKVQL